MARNKHKNGEAKVSKKFWKKWWFWLIIVLVFIVLFPTDNSDNTKEPEKQTKITETKEPETTVATTTVTEEQATETPETGTEATETETPEATEKAEEPVAGKNIDDIGEYVSVSHVQNDVTGNWRISTIAENIDIEEYALSYYKKYFKSDNEIHAIVNFSRNTTTRISVVSDLLDVCIYDYVDKEEHDAKRLFGGTLLKEYFVHMDNGEIEEVQ